MLKGYRFCDKKRGKATLIPRQEIGRKLHQWSTLAHCQKIPTRKRHRELIRPRCGRLFHSLDISLPHSKSRSGDGRNQVGWWVLQPILYPRKLNSDQGKQFESEVIAGVCELLKIDKTRTTPYHPQSDGLVERFYRRMVNILATCARDHPFDWETHVKNNVHGLLLQHSGLYRFLCSTQC